VKLYFTTGKTSQFVEPTVISPNVFLEKCSELGWNQTLQTWTVRQALWKQQSLHVVWYVPKIIGEFTRCREQYM